MAAEITQTQPAVNRWVTPSLSDLFFLFVTVWMFLVSPVGWQRLLLDADAALHIRIGQYILATGSVPHQDLFAFTKPGQAWYAFEWLAEVTYGAMFNLAGYKGVVLLAGMMISLYVTLLLKWSIWKGANGMMSLFVILVAASATSVHFYARPHLFTLLFLAAALWILDYNRERGGKLVWTLVPLTALWANLHGGFVIFLALVFLRFVGCAGEAWFWPELRDARRREAVQLAQLGIACGLASLANPYGFNLHLHLLETLQSPWIKENVAEFKSPEFRSEELYHFMILLFAGLACLVPLVKKKQLVAPLVLLFLAYCSLVSVRHLTIFVLVAAPIIAVELSDFWNHVTRSAAKSSVLGLLGEISGKLTDILPGTSLFIPVTIAALAVIPGIPWPTEFPDEGFPVKLVEQNRELLANSRVFSPDQVSDFLIFRNYPRQRVFFDSRHNYYGEKIGNDYLGLLGGAPNWKTLLDIYSVDALLIRRDGPLAALTAADGGWREIARDDKFAIYTRGKP